MSSLTSRCRRSSRATSCLQALLFIIGLLIARPMVRAQSVETTSSTSSSSQDGPAREWIRRAQQEEEQDPDAYLTVPDLVNVTSGMVRGLCATPSPTDCEKTLMWLVDQRWKKAQRRRQRGLLRQQQRSLSVNTNLYNIAVVFHVMAQEGTGDTVGVIKRAQRKALMGRLKSAFEDTPFEFSFSETITTKNNAYHECSSLIDYQRQNCDRGPNVLNVILCDTRKMKFVSPRGATTYTPKIGQATFPHWLADGDDDARVADGVVLQTPIPYIMSALSEDVVPGGVPATSELEVVMTFVHEVGHWLGLLHTFEGGCSPKLNSATYPSGAVGDGVTDTAAEKTAAWHSSGWKQCFSNKERLPDTCSNKKEGVDAGEDPVNNFMDYNHQDCADANGQFTEMQKERMQAHYEKYRLSIEPDSGNERRLGGTSTSEFIPDDELVLTCVRSAVEECSCKKQCVYKFQDLLRDFLPYPKFEKLKRDVLKSCTACERIMSSEECPRGEYCTSDWKNGNVGLTCKPADRNFCFDDGYCLAGERCSFFRHQCVPALPKCNSQGGCDNGQQYCEPVSNECRYKSSKACQADEDCLGGLSSRFCTNGLCSSCKKDDDCPWSSARCMGSSLGRYDCSMGAPEDYACSDENPCKDLNYCTNDGVCKPLEPVGAACSSDEMCANKCLDGKCSGCLAAGPIVAGGQSWCGANDMHFCSDSFNGCKEKRDTSGYCIANWQCLSNDCRDGVCYGDCSSNDHCPGKNPYMIGIGASTCRDQFCVVQSNRYMAVTETDITNYNFWFDCRSGYRNDWCTECSADWQCREEQFCNFRHQEGGSWSPRGRCESKRLSDGSSECRSSRECASNSCYVKANPKVCVGTPWCERNSDCPSNEYCSGFRCKAKMPTSTDSSCTAHHECQSGVCALYGTNDYRVHWHPFCTECNYDIDCIKAGDATKKVCYKDGRKCFACQVDEHCGTDQYCYKTSPNGWVKTTEFYCKAKPVQPECSSNADCVYPRPFCTDGGFCSHEAPPVSK